MLEEKECELCMNAVATTTHETSNFEYAVCSYCKDLATFEEFDDDEDW